MKSELLYLINEVLADSGGGSGVWVDWKGVHEDAT